MSALAGWWCHLPAMAVSGVGFGAVVVAAAVLLNMLCLKAATIVFGAGRGGGC